MLNGLTSLTSKVEALTLNQAKYAQPISQEDCFQINDSSTQMYPQEVNYLGYVHKGDLPVPEWSNSNHRNIPGFRWSDPNGCANPEVLNQGAP